MCEPATIAMIGMGLSAGGSFLEQKDSNKNAKRVQQAKEGAFEASNTRQKAFADEAAGAFNENTNNQGRESFDERSSNEANRINEAFTGSRVQPDYNTGLTSNAPKNVITAREDASSEAGAKSDRDANAFAKLGGYKGATFNQGLDRNKFAQLFGNTQSKASGDAGLLGLNMQSAGANASKSPALFPQLLKAGGQAMSMYGAGGGSLSNTVEGPLAAGSMGPGIPQTSYGMFQNGKPLQAFGQQAVF